MRLKGELEENTSFLARLNSEIEFKEKNGQYTRGLLRRKRKRSRILEERHVLMNAIMEKMENQGEDNDQEGTKGDHETSSKGERTS